MIKKIKDRLYGLAVDYSPKFGLDLPYFIQGGFWLVLAQAFAMFKNFILSILFANWITKDIYGQYVFIMGVLSISIIFSLPNLKPSITQAVSNGFDGTYTVALKRSIKFSFLGSIFMFCSFIYCHIAGRIYGEKIFLVMILLFPLYHSSSFFSALYSGKEKFSELSVLNVIFSLVSLLIISLVIFFKKDLFSIVLSTVLVKIIIQGYYTFFYAMKDISNAQFSRENIDFGMKTNLSEALNIFATYFDSILVPIFINFESLAIYTIITVLPNQIKVAFNTFTPLFLPKLSKNKITKKQLLSHVIKILIIAVIGILIYILLAPFIFDIFYKPYSEYVWMSLLYSVSLLILPQRFLVAVLQSRLNVKKINTLNYFLSSLLIVSALIGVQFGLLGLVISRIVFRLLIIIIIIILTHMA